MSTIFALAIVAALIALAFNFLRYLVPSQKPSAGKWIKVSIATIVVSLIATMFFQTRENDDLAKCAGFVSGNEYSAAKKAGISDPKHGKITRVAEANAAAMEDGGW